MTFYEWAMKRRITDDPAGDFLKDMREDREAVDVPNNKASWELHLSRGCEEAREAFRELWGRYQRSSAQTQPVGAGYVYFIQADEILFKIGLTNQNPHKRLASIQTSYPHQLVLYGYISTNQPKVLETEIHQRLSVCRAHGEWFKVLPDTIDKILAEHGERPR